MSFLLLLTGVVDAQRFSTYKFGVQFKGPVISILTANDSRISANGVNLSYGFGLQAEFGFSDNVYLSTGFGFAGNIGGVLKHDIGGNLWPEARLTNPAFNTGIKPLPDGTSLRYRLNMLELPVALKFYSRSDGNRQFYLEAPALSLGIVIRSRGAITADGLRLEDQKINEETRLFNIGLGGGLGVAYDLGFAEAQIGLQYNWIFTDVVRNNGRKAIDTGSGNFTQLDENSRNNMHLIGIKLALLF